MASHQLRKIIFGLTALWFVLGALLAAAAFLQWIEKSLFSNLFIGGFVLYCVVVAILSQLLTGVTEDEQNHDSDDS